MSLGIIYFGGLRRGLLVLLLESIYKQWDSARLPLLLSMLVLIFQTDERNGQRRLESGRGRNENLYSSLASRGVGRRRRILMGGVSLFLTWANIFLLSTLYSSQNFANEHMRLCKKKRESYFRACHCFSLQIPGTDSHRPANISTLLLEYPTILLGHPLQSPANKIAS